jgi:6-pyruvoyltetrahydropterin/6-carboxytetrahydropterin synthase
MKYFSTKTYGHERGLSCAFRQPQAKSHCRYVHGYALSFSFTFGCDELDENNWVVDFGGLKSLKDWLEKTFDHKLCLDENDPNLHHFHVLEDAGLCEIEIMDGVGVEKFAEHAFKFADKNIKHKTGGRCWVESVEVKEHGANGAIVKRSERNE